MAALRKLSVAEVAQALEQPFSMANVALVGDIVVSVYICQGLLDWHRHIDHDELFWVHEGTIVLESECGEVALRPGEMAVVPKGIRHRSGSVLRASVLLLRCGVASERKNGRRRLYGTGGAAELRRINLPAELHAASFPFDFRTAARIEGTAVQVAAGEGTWPVELPAPHDLLYLVLRGSATVWTSESVVHLLPGELTALPFGTTYQLSTTRDTALVRLTREDAP